MIKRFTYKPDLTAQKAGSTSARYINIKKLSNYILGLLAILVVYLGNGSQTVSFNVVLMFTAIFLILYVGNKIVNHGFLRIFQFLFLFYVILSYVIPFIASISTIDYVNHVKDYSLSVDDQMKWVLMVVYDCISLQVSIVLSQLIFRKNNLKTILPRINIRVAVIFGFTMIFITALFRFGLGTGKYSEGVMVANPLAQLLIPDYLVFMVIASTVSSLYVYYESIYKYSKKTKLLAVFLVIAWLLFEVLNGSRAGILTIFLISFSAMLLSKNMISRKALFYLFVSILLSIPLYVISTVARGWELDLAVHFFRSDSIASSIFFAVSQRVGLMDNLFQIANETYNSMIYSEIGFLQMIKSTFDLIMPGTYFPGVYSQSALNQVWLYNYTVEDIANDWSSISVSLYAMNYLYFGKVGSFFVTGFVNFLYIYTATKLINKNNVFYNFFAMFLLYSYQPYFLTSFGYEYLFRWLLFGIVHIYFWSWVLAYKSKTATQA